MNRRLIFGVLAVCLSAAMPAFSNTAPDAPQILEPRNDGQIVSGEDVHMAIGAFQDADSGQQHLCTDFEIVSTAAEEIVWAARCVTDPGVRLHAHLGDGAFAGTLEGRHALLFDTDYTLRVRVRDDSGDAATEWSAWSARAFHTAAASVVEPLEIDDVAADPPPSWVDATGVDVSLDDGSSLQLETASEGLLYEMRGERADNPPALGVHEPLRLVLHAGALGLQLPETDLRFFDRSSREITIALPAARLGANGEARFWVSSNGSTYVDEGGPFPSFGVLARGAAVPWLAPRDYRVEVFAKGFRLPVDIAFVPNPRNDPGAPFFYVTELYGGIKVVTRDGHVGDYATDLLNYDPTAPFPGPGERGLTGLAVDPATGDVFASMTAAAPDESLEPRIVRLFSTDGGLHATGSSLVLAMTGTPQSASHQISNLSIGPDGNLYVHVGDAMRWWYAQDPDSLLGKVLRMHLDGSPVETNPFFNPADGITARDYVYTYGYRNPFGGSWRAADQSLYCVENGPAVDRMTRVVEGRNYLWDYSDNSMFEFALYNWWPAAAPVGIAFVQDTTFGGSGFPPSARDHAFVTESGPTWALGMQRTGKRIREFSFAGDGSIAAGTPFVEYTGDGHASASGIAAGPDGLYFADLYADAPDAGPTDRGSNILRVRFVGSAHFTASPSAADPLQLNFADTSTLPGVISAAWSFGDGTSSSERAPVHRYAASGIYEVRLRVDTAGGKSSVASSGVLVGRGAGSGLYARYFGDHEMTAFITSRIDPAIDVSGTEGTFAVRWSGTIQPRFSQSYTFSTLAAGDVRLWIGDQLLIDDWIGHPRGRDSALIVLEAGKHYPITLEYATTQTQPDIHFFWESESQPKELVPSEALYPARRLRPVIRDP